MQSKSIFDLAALLCTIPLCACVAETPDKIEYFQPAESIAIEHGSSIEPAFAPGVTPRAPELRVLLTDAPADVDAVFVSIDLVLAYACADESCTTGSWVELMDEAVTVDLLTLQGATAELAELDLPAGTYEQVALFLSEASIVVRGEEYELPISNEMPSVLHRLDLENGTRTELTLDFDAERSLLWSNDAGWSLRPALEHVSTTVVEL